MSEQGPKKHVKFTVIFMIVFFLGMQVFGTFFFARSTSAITGAPDVVAALTTKWTTDSIWDGLLAAGMGALVNAASYFMRKLAFDSAKYVASGGKGQGALAFKEGAGKYFEQVALDTAASAIDQFGEGLFGMSLCRPPDLRIQAFIQVGLRKLYDDPNSSNGPAPRCQWNEFKESWEQGAETGFGLDPGVDSASEFFAQSLRVEESDFGIAIGLHQQVGRHVSEKKAGAQADRAEGEGFKSLEGLISGNVKTPAQLIKEETKTLTAKQQGELSTQQIAGVYGSGLLQVIPSALSVFLNTLTSSLLNTLLTDGLFPDSADDGGTGLGVAEVGNPFAAVLNVNRAAAEKAFSYLITQSPVQLSEFDVVNTYVNCPGQGKDAGLNNCVMDDGLRQAVQRARNGEPITIAEAMDPKVGLLDPNKQIISPLREADNGNKTKCWTEAYCYSNIQKLRRVRILPLGFEIAALKSDPDEPWTLGDVVAGFEDCKFNDAGVAIASAAHPFCHLIDPNWVIKAPAAQCQAFVSGPELVTNEGPQRREECVDISTCLGRDADGRCVEYGYCTLEENTWRVGGTSCEPHEATCDAYTNTKSGQTTTYLSRTLDFGQCTQEDVGCRSYALAKDAEGAWISSGSLSEADMIEDTLKGRKKHMYFNDNISSETCLDKFTGCHAFYPQLANGDKGTAPLYLRKAPEHLGCYDIDPATEGIQWPEKDADFAAFADRPAECEAYAQVCIEDEVECRAYQPLDDNTPELTGVIGANNCVSSCVGYDTFKQEDSHFENEQFPLFFIPTQAEQCSAIHSGCSEFTNIDAASDGGEQREYYSKLRYCEKPNEDKSNEKVFYSWEGSSSEGYVLRIHRMLQVDEAAAGFATVLNPDIDIAVEAFYPVGSPAYVEETKESLEEKYDNCNEENYTILLNNPGSVDAAVADCRRLYDDEGSMYYRTLDDTVTVSDACHPLRITESSLVYDEQITALGGFAAQSTCAEKGGVYGDDPTEPGVFSVCRRCKGGGKYEDGACVYQTITEESLTCPATANKCRAFTGNLANDVQEIFDITFEPEGDDEDALLDAMEGWTDGEISAEATLVSQNSLKVESNLLRYIIEEETLEKDGWYELSFWAKGVPQTFSITIRQDINGGNNFSWVMADFTADPVLPDVNVNVSIGQTWQEYRLGPVPFTGDSDFAAQLRFVSIQDNIGEPYFIDNVRLTRQNKTHLIRDSWKIPNDGLDVPEACDANPDDGLPGVYLGCRAYQDVAANVPVYATGFERLCRPEAAGCKGLFDTHNTIDSSDEALVHIYNARCVGESGETCALTAEGEQLVQCEIPIGKSECYIEGKIALDSVESIDQNTWVAPSTVVVPADDETPVFLTNRIEFACNKANLGCTDFALEEQNLVDTSLDTSFSFNTTDTLLKNNPDRYSETLCRDDLIGCSEHRSGNNIVYFKDPVINGNAICSYNKQGVGPEKITGWFLDGVGVCEVDDTKLEEGQEAESSGTQCRSASDCSAVESCVKVGEQPCYTNFLKVGGEYGLWSQESENYEGLVGSCGFEANGCTELVDRADGDIDPITQKPEGKPYYVIFDADIEKRRKQCDGKVSLKEGCVLFDKADAPNKLYNTLETYEKSVEQHHAAVLPVINDDNDSNILLKVVRDRQCAEWLSCKTSVPSVSEDGTPVELCYEYKACKERDAHGVCIDWVGNDGLPSQLTYQKYVQRPTGWYDTEYAGYSLFNKYQINDYTTLNFEGDHILYLATEARNSALEAAGTESCLDASGKIVADGTPCASGSGRCFTGSCIFPIDRNLQGFPAGDNLSENAIKAVLNPGVCKAFPERDSPFEQTFILESDGILKDYGLDDSIYRYDFLQKKTEFANANVCQGDGCACEYRKAEYENKLEADYWPRTGEIIPNGVCIGGEKNNKAMSGFPCDVDSDCGDAGTGLCSRKVQEGRYFGQRGFCLEEDKSRIIGQAQTGSGIKKEYACLTWLPAEISASTIDFQNAELDAGYNPDKDAAGEGIASGQVYCAQGTKAGRYHLLSGVSSDADFDGIYSNATHGTPNPCLDCHNGNPGHFGQDGMLWTDNGYRIDAFGTHWLADDYFRVLLHCEHAGGTYKSPGYWAQQDDDGDWHHMTPSPYVLSACEPSASHMHKPLQKWAWEQKGDNAIVLRIEGGASSNSQDVNQYHFDFGYKGGNKSDIVSFAPFLANEAEAHCNDTGLVQHAPRTFGKVPQTYYTQNYEGSDLAGCASSYNTRYHEPGAGGSFGQGHVSGIEKDMSESLLQEVCFVPLMTPGGHDGGVYYPSLMNQDLCMQIGTPQDEMPPGLNFTDSLAVWGHMYEYIDSGGDETPGYLNGDTMYFPLEKSENGVHVWTYMQTKDQIDQTSHSISQSADYLTPELAKRNEINHRYVLVMYHRAGNGAAPGGIGTIFPNVGNGIDKFTPDAKAQDPLARKALGGENVWIAIGMDFNAEGEFLGYVSRFRYAAGGGSGLRFATIAKLNSSCTDYVNVYDETADPLLDHTNKAWTHRTWEQTAQKSHPTTNYSFISQDTPMQPFGSLQLTASDLVNDDKLLGYTFASAELDGVPYSCVGQLLGMPNIPGPSNCAALQSAHKYGGLIPTDHKDRTVADAELAIQHLFAQAFKRKIYNVEINANDSFIDGTVFDKSGGGTSGIDPKAPMVFALNPATCGSGTEACTAGEPHNITVSGRNYSNFDYDQDSKSGDENFNNTLGPDVHIAKSAFVADVEFFAFADDNQMPLRRVMVNWGDGSPITNDGVMGLYKNRKPFCNAGSTGPSALGRCKRPDGSTSNITCRMNITNEAGLSPDCIDVETNQLTECVSGAKMFGDSARACTTANFEFLHRYTCTQTNANGTEVGRAVSDLPTEDQNRLAEFGVDSSARVCVFKPKVQVLDNWGWCNGTDGNGNPFAYYADKKLPNGAIDNKCLPEWEFAWTPYKGHIIVIPAEE